MLAAVLLDHRHDALRAVLHRHRGARSAHVGPNPARMQRQQGQVAAAHFAPQPARQRIQRGLAGAIEFVAAGVLRHAAHDRGGERHHAGFRADMADQRPRQTDGRDGVGEHQRTDFVRRRGVGAAMFRSRHAGVDQDGIDHLVAERAGEAVQRGGDRSCPAARSTRAPDGPPAARAAPRPARIAGGGDDLPAMGQKLLRHAQADAALAPTTSASRCSLMSCQSSWFMPAVSPPGAVRHAIVRRFAPRVAMRQPVIRAGPGQGQAAAIRRTGWPDPLVRSGRNP